MANGPDHADQADRRRRRLNLPTMAPAAAPGLFSILDFFELGHASAMLFAPHTDPAASRSKHALACRQSPPAVVVQPVMQSLERPASISRCQHRHGCPRDHGRASSAPGRARREDRETLAAHHRHPRCRCPGPKHGPSRRRRCVVANRPVLAPVSTGNGNRHVGWGPGKGRWNAPIGGLGFDPHRTMGRLLLCRYIGRPESSNGKAIKRAATPPAAIIGHLQPTYKLSVRSLRRSRALYVLRWERVHWHRGMATTGYPS